MLYHINLEKEYDLSKNSEYLESHKRAVIRKEKDYYTVKYNAEHDMNSAGFRLLLNTKPGKVYKLDLRGRLVKGDRAFVYCESMYGERLIPRVHFISPSLWKEYTLSFIPNTDQTYLGILFFSGQLDYELHLTRFNITEIELIEDMNESSIIDGVNRRKITERRVNTNRKRKIRKNALTQNISTMTNLNPLDSTNRENTNRENTNRENTNRENTNRENTNRENTNRENTYKENTNNSEPALTVVAPSNFSNLTSQFKAPSEFAIENLESLNKFQERNSKYPDILLQESRSRGTRERRIAIRPGRSIKKAKRDLRRRNWRYSTEPENKTETQYDSSDSNDLVNFDTLVEKYNKLKNKDRSTAIPSEKEFKSNFSEAESESSLNWDTAGNAEDVRDVNQIENHPKEVYIEPEWNIKNHSYISLLQKNQKRFSPFTRKKREDVEQEEKQVQRIENIVLKERQNVVTKQAKQRVIISFSVPFFELNKLKNVIKKLGEISNIFDQIYLNIPYDFTQNGEESETFHDENQKTIALPQWLGDSSIESFKLKLRANRCPNWGPLTKVFGVLPLEKEDDTILIFITPDNEIDQEEITNLISRIKLSKSTSYSYYGYRDINNLDIVALSTLGSGLICKRSFFNNTINQLKQVSLPDLLEFPDLLLSGYLTNNNISLELITAQKDLEKRRIQELSLDKYSETLKKYDFLNYKVLTLKSGFTSTVVTSTVVTSTMEGKNNMIENATQINDPTIGKIVQTEQGNAKFHLNKNYLSKILQFEEQRIKQKTNLEIRHKIISGIKIHYKDVDANVIKESKVAVIVEPRNDPLLPLLIRNFMEVLGEDWTFQIFHGLNNEVRLKKAFGFNRLILEKNKNWKVMFNKMEVENLSRDEYSRLLLEKDFYELCRGEHILIYQLDSCLNPNSQFKIDRFLEYDYIGAPWIHGQRSLVNGRDRIFIGNGGLSLRKRSTMVEVCEILQSGYRHLLNKNEDLVISSLLHSQHFKDKVNLPDPYLARKFSVELIYEPRSLGVHKAWKYLSRDDLDKLMKEVPQVNEFFVGKYFSL